MGVAIEQIEACGLIRSGDDIPVSYDWFRDRIMFPIEDRRGRVIAFGGRAMSPEVAAKYMNSPDTELFHKGEVLYNFARARKGQGKDGTVIAVEGYMDVIALAQAGFENAVAPLGTALTENQMELLWKMTPEPVLCFDGDQAGLRAAWRAADMILPSVQAGRTARFALLPEGKDPDDLVKAEGPEAFRTVLGEARALSELLWMRETAGGVFDTPERRADLEKTLRELASRIRDESVRFHYQQDMRDRVHAFFGAARHGGQPNRQNQGNDRNGFRNNRPGQAGGPPRRVGKPGPIGDGQARRRHHALARNCAAGSAGQPSAPDRREFRPCRNARTLPPRPAATARGDHRRSCAWRCRRPREPCALRCTLRAWTRYGNAPSCWFAALGSGLRWKAPRWRTRARLSPRRCTCSAAPATYIGN